MLTRHWYDRDSVGDALFQAAGAWRDPLRKQKLIFWTYELVLSEETDYLWGILERISWRWGSSATHALVHRSGPRAPLDFLQTLLALPTPAPFDPPAAAAETEIPLHPQTPDVPTSWLPSQRSRLWIAVRDAVAHRRSLRLLRLLGALAPQVAAKYLGAPTDGKQGIYHMLETVGCPVLPTSSSAPLCWPNIPIGRVAARLFAVPRTHAPTGPVSPLATKEGCAFWRRIWATEDEDIIWSTYFVDDVPDEWSVAEQAKSHLLH